jgi:endonuclease/exonuclease/phosphatase family metal-dependent hydrolase
MTSQKKIVVANFNIHAGIDGWGRHFDAVAACASIDADVLIIDEDWVGDDESESIGSRLAEEAGYTIVTASFGRARRRLAPANPVPQSTRWAPRRGPGYIRPLVLEGRPRSARGRATRTALAVPSTRGEWGTSFLSRLPVLRHELLELPRLRADPASRKAIVATLDTGSDSPITVIGVHLGHLTHGSTRQMKTLRRFAATLDGPKLLVGDLNCWGPPLRITLHGLHDAVTGPTWPSWRPHSRIDHILVSDPTLVVSHAVLPFAGSDHLPIRCVVRVP